IGGFSARGTSAVRRERGVHSVVLPERVPFPIFRQEDAPKIGMALEDDAKHVVALALHPVCATIELRQRRAPCLPRPQARAHREGHVRVEVLDATEHFQPLVLPVHGGEPVEVGAAERLLGEATELLPALSRYGDGEPTVGHHVHPESLVDARARVGGRHAPPGSAAVGRRPVFWNSSTCAWSLSSPYMSESGVGGHPGTYTSTGTTRSTLLTT